MNKPFPYAAAIFDLDGTLLDSMHVWADIDVEFLHKRGLNVPPDYSEVLAPMTFRETAEYTIQRFNLNETPEDVMDEWDRMAVDAYSNDVQLKDGAKEYLELLRSQGVKLGVCTALSRKIYIPTLKHLGVFDYFDAIVSTDDVHCAKTQPTPFLATAEKLGVKPEDCIVYEDVLEAIEGAKKAGMTVCGVYDMTSEKFTTKIRSTADQFLFSFTELLKK